MADSIVILPSTIPEMRAYLLDGIQRILNHPFILGLSEVDKAVLQAEYRLYSVDDSAVSIILSTLQALYPVSQKEFHMSVKAIDWGSLLAKLESLAAQIPTIAEDVKQVIEDILTGLQTKKAKVKAAAGPAKCDRECKDMVCEVLCEQRHALVKALFDNLCTQDCIECCCPEDEDGPPDHPPSV